MADELVYTNRNQRPPFKPGNALALTHGAHSARVYGPLAKTLMQRAVKELPLLGDPSYGPELEQWSIAYAKVILYTDWLANVDYEAEDFNPDRHEWARKELRFWSKRASELAHSLGLTPMSRMVIGKNMSAIATAGLFDPMEGES